MIIPCAFLSSTFHLIPETRELSPHLGLLVLSCRFVHLIYWCKFLTLYYIFFYRVARFFRDPFCLTLSLHYSEELPLRYYSL